MEWTSYHRLDDILGYLDYLADTYPDVCSVQTIGHSIEGRPLKVIIHISFAIYVLILMKSSSVIRFFYKC